MADYESRLLTECELEQLDAAGVYLDVGDDGELCYVWAATGEVVDDPSTQRVMVPRPADDHDEAFAADLLRSGPPPFPSNEELLIRRRPRRVLRPVLGSAAALALFAGVGAGLTALVAGEDRPSSVPSGTHQAQVTVPTVPVSVTRWSEQAKATLADVEMQLADAQRAVDAWNAMSPDRRRGLVPAEVSDLQAHAAELRRVKTALEADLAAAESLRTNIENLSDVKQQLVTVERALSEPPAPPSESVTERLHAQRELLAKQAEATQASVKRYQSSVEQAATTPLPEVSESDVDDKVIALAEQPADPTPEPVREQVVAARAPDEDTTVVEQPADPPEPPEPEGKPADEPRDDEAGQGRGVVERASGAAEVTVGGVEVAASGTVERVTEKVTGPPDPKPAKPEPAPKPEREPTPAPVATVPEPPDTPDIPDPDIPDLPDPAEEPAPQPQPVPDPAPERPAEPVSEPVSVPTAAETDRAAQAAREVAERAGQCGKAEGASLTPQASDEQRIAALGKAAECVSEAMAETSPEDRAAMEKSVRSQLSEWDFSGKPSQGSAGWPSR